MTVWLWVLYEENKQKSVPSSADTCMGLHTHMYTQFIHTNKKKLKIYKLVTSLKHLFPKKKKDRKIH